jgi:hypothetical protein
MDAINGDGSGGASSATAGCGEVDASASGASAAFMSALFACLPIYLFASKTVCMKKRK